MTTSSNVQGLWYGPDGSQISEADALILLTDAPSRQLASTKMKLMGRTLYVVTVFVPVDFNPDTWGTETSTPTCWVTEIIGGPDDLNGVVEYSQSREQAGSTHQLVVERATASGCTEA